MAQSNPLRALIQRLTSTPVEELPSVAYFLASSISRALVAQDAPSTDRTVLLHKLKTRISSLLQDRTREGRFTAVVLAKAVIEAGGREILVDAEPWIRGLIAILNKPDPVSTKKLVIITVSRAFMLTQQHPSLIREITTPLLPSFITACLGAIRPKTTKTEERIHNVLSPLLSIVLQVWTELLPDHPATFRPFVTRFRPICLSLLSDSATSATISKQAGALLVALHHSASKNNATSEWLQLYEDIIHAAHSTASQLFRSVHEEWVPTKSSTEPTAGVINVNKDFPSTGQDKIGLAGWSGIHSGAQRLSRLLTLLTISISSATVMDVPLRLGGIMDVCARILALTVPGGGKDSPYIFKSNAEFGKDERECLWSEIPTVHVSCLRLLCVAVEVLQNAILPISKSIIELIAWVFGAEQDLQDVRESSYDLLRALTPISGPTMTDTDFKLVSGMVRFACRDLLPPDQSGERKAGVEKGGKNAVANVDSFIGAPKIGVKPMNSLLPSTLQKTAGDLISTVIQYVPAQAIPNSLRTDVDRTAILSRQSRTLLASVLNPGKIQTGHHSPPSVLPFLAQCGAGLEVEALLRPRMPVVVDKQATSSDLDMSEAAKVNYMQEHDIFHRANTLDRLEESLKLSTPAITTPEATQTVSKQILPSAQGTAFTAEKRDFASMNGNDLNGLNADDSSTPSFAENEAKKARIDVDAMAPSKLLDSNQLSEQITASESVSPDENNYGSAMVQQPRNETGDVRQATSNTKMETNMQIGSKSTDLVIDVDGSDSDVPQINIEPDTDEEDDSDIEMDE